MKSRIYNQAKLFIAPSTISPQIAGLYSMDPIAEGQYIVDYKGKIRPEHQGKYDSLQSGINEFCDRTYSFKIDK